VRNDSNYCTVKTKNVNEAAFYLQYGGKYLSTHHTRLNKKQSDKKGFSDQWTIVVENVPVWAVDTWRSEITYINVHTFLHTRKKLKQWIANDQVV
jgi:hypothetical protein